MLSSWPFRGLQWSGIHDSNVAIVIAKCRGSPATAVNVLKWQFSSLTGLLRNIPRQSGTIKDPYPSILQPYAFSGGARG
jgi:hypothetical protein